MSKKTVPTTSPMLGGVPVIVMRPTGELNPYQKNSRKHTAEQVRKVARSIQEFGWTNPILVDQAGTVVAGHARLLAAKSLKLAEVPTICLSSLTPTQIRAYVIADNQLALDAGWDENLLRSEMEDLKLSDFDLTLTGFGEAELRDLFADADAPPEGFPNAEAMANDTAHECPKCGYKWSGGK